MPGKADITNMLQNFIPYSSLLDGSINPEFVSWANDPLAQAILNKITAGTSLGPSPKAMLQEGYDISTYAPLFQTHRNVLKSSPQRTRSSLKEVSRPSRHTSPASQNARTARPPSPLLSPLGPNYAIGRTMWFPV